jgi:hypothetical protein
MRNVCSVIPLIIILCPLVCEAKKIPLTVSSLVPSAQGTVETGKDRNNNTKVKIEIEHLAKPERLSPPKSSYVVWVQERGAEPVNEGQLKVDNKLQGSFETVTPSKNFEVFVTAEDDPDVKAPSGPEVARASVSP